MANGLRELAAKIQVRIALDYSRRDGWLEWFALPPMTRERIQAEQTNLILSLLAADRRES